MATAFAHVSYVEKEKVSGLIFPPNEVLHSSDGIERRLNVIDQAIDAGNFAQFKVMILFEDEKEIKEVETTIWDRDTSNIYLKNSIAIPIGRIHKIRFS